MSIIKKKITIRFGSIVVPFGKLEGTGQEQGFFLDLSWVTKYLEYYQNRQGHTLKNGRIYVLAIACLRGQYRNYCTRPCAIISVPPEKECEN